jgi:hypothetical protein
LPKVNPIDKDQPDIAKKILAGYDVYSSQLLI